MTLGLFVVNRDCTFKQKDNYALEMDESENCSKGIKLYINSVKS